MSQHFTIAELTHSDTAIKYGINNIPTGDILLNMQCLMDGLENIRSLLGDKPITINSGYRCKELNDVVHGVHHSAHEQGYAADFVCPDFGIPIAIVRFLKTTPLVFDQIIQEGKWVHVSFAPEARQQVLTANFRIGGTTYTQGA